MAIKRVKKEAKPAKGKEKKPVRASRSAPKEPEKGRSQTKKTNRQQTSETWGEGHGWGSKNYVKTKLTRQT